MTTSNKTKETGNVKHLEGVEISDGPIDPDLKESLAKPSLVRISLMIDQDLLEQLKQKAKHDPVSRGKYQVLIRDLLRKSLSDH